MNQKGIYDHIDTAFLVKALRQYVDENRFSSNPRTILFGLAADRLEEFEKITRKDTSITPLVIANTFIHRYGKDNELCHMKLQNLVFYSYGWWLVEKRMPLFRNEKPEIWRYGPVFSSLYNFLVGRGSKAITEPVSRSFLEEPQFLPQNADDALQAQTSKLVDWIWDKYGGFDAIALSWMANAPHTPWHTAASKRDFCVPDGYQIADEIMLKYFSKLVNPGGE